MGEKISCPDCGAPNQNQAKFCSQCGTALPAQNISEIFCTNCGRKNPSTVKYCFNCGHPFQAGHGKKKHPQKKISDKKQTAPKQQASNTLKIAAGILASVLFLFFISKFQDTSGRQDIQTKRLPVEKKLSNPMLEAKVMEIASKFICSCGGCGEDPLDKCDCETAKNERNFIRRAVVNGQDAEDIIRSVNLKFGWIKAPFKEKYGAGKPVNIVKTKQFESLFPDIAIKQNVKPQILASLADRLTIISRFACPCGQCNIEELKECECSHPRGAREVKRFIDDKIAAGKYSVNNIIQFVSNEYGNKIR